jgi:hypothetical protein
LFIVYEDAARNDVSSLAMQFQAIKPPTVDRTKSRRTIFIKLKRNLFRHLKKGVLYKTKKPASQQALVLLNIDR